MTIRRAALAVFLAFGVLVASFTAAQQAKSYRFAFLALAPEQGRPLMRALVERLRELGYTEGRNMTFDYRSAEGRPERLPALAAELVRARPDVLITGFGTLAAKAAKAATPNIPIVFTAVGDPVGAGLVASLGHPGANVTGLTDQARDLGGKQLQLLRELVPGMRAVAVLMNPDTLFTALALKDIKAAAEIVRLPVNVLEARTAEDVPRKLEAIGKTGSIGLLVLPDPLTVSIRRQIADLAIRRRLPTISGYRDFVESGGLMSYGADHQQMYQRAAEYVDRIVKGARPAELPIEQPTKFELAINLKTAKAIGLSVPASALARADHVIE